MGSRTRFNWMRTIKNVFGVRKVLKIVIKVGLTIGGERGVKSILDK